MIKLTGLWKGKTKKGEPMLSGSISPTSGLLILPNTYKKADKEPDFIAFITEKEKKAEEKPEQQKGASIF